jgi:hypothetical protein
MALGDIKGVIENAGGTYDEILLGAYLAPTSIYPATGLTTGYIPYKTATVLADSPAYTDGLGRMSIGDIPRLLGAYTPRLSSALVGDGTDFTLLKYVNSNSGVNVNFAKSKGATLNTHATVTSGTAIASLAFMGSDGTTFVKGADFNTQVDGTVSTGIVPMRFMWRTMDTSGMIAERMRLTNIGDLGIGTTAPTSIGTGITTLDIQGDTSGGVAFGPSGTKNKIYGGSILYVDANNQLALVTAGYTRATILNTGEMGVGTTAPSVRLTAQSPGSGAAVGSGTVQTYGALRLQDGATSVLDFGVNGANGSWIQSTNSGSLGTEYPLAFNPNGGPIFVGYSADPTSGNTLAVNGNGYLNGSLTATSLVKSGGTSAQVLKADGSVENQTFQTLSGTTPTLNVVNGINAKITISGITTITLSNLVAGMTGDIRVENPATLYTLTVAGYTNEVNRAVCVSTDVNQLSISGGSKVDWFSWKYTGTELMWNGTKDVKIS